MPLNGCYVLRCRQRRLVLTTPSFSTLGTRNVIETTDCHRGRDGDDCKTNQDFASGAHEAGNADNFALETESLCCVRKREAREDHDTRPRRWRSRVRRGGDLAIVRWCRRVLTGIAARKTNAEQTAPSPHPDFVAECLAHDPQCKPRTCCAAGSIGRCAGCSLGVAFVYPVRHRYSSGRRWSRAGSRRRDGWVFAHFVDFGCAWRASRLRWALLGRANSTDARP